MKKSILILAASVFLFFNLNGTKGFAQYADNNEACFYRATGKGISYAELPEKSKIWSKGMNFTCWNGSNDPSCGNGFAIGSQNHPVMAAMGWGDYKWIAELCRWEKGHGIFGRELGAPAYYFANVVACKLIALRDARAAGAYADAKDIAESLRCVWAYDALVAAATPRKNCWINLHGQIYTNAGDAAGYDGLTVAAAGDRWHTETNISSDAHGIFLTWAIDWQPRSITPNKNLLTSNGKWWMENTAQLTGVAYYNLTTDPEVFGLNAAERQKLRDVVNGDVNAALWAAQVVANFGTWKDPNVPVADCFHKIRMRKTTLGAEIIYFNATNGNKPCQAATQIFNNGDYKSIRPNFYHGTGANNGYTCWVANGLIQADAPGDGAYVSMPEMGGAVLWEVNIDGSVVEFNGNVVSSAGQASYPNGPDVGVTAFINPASNITTTTVTPKVTIKNFGSSNVNNVYISYQLNNGVMWTTTWRGTLAPNATVNVTLWNAPVTPGSYTLKAFTGGPNYQNDNTASNDSQTMTFTVGSASVIDAGINTIVAPVASITDDSLKPIAKLKNFGNTNLTSVSVRYKLDGGPAVIYPWTGTLAPNSTVNVNLAGVPVAAGTHTIQIYTLNPNAQTDANAGNDSQTLTFDVTSPFMTDVLAVSLGEPLNSGCATGILPLFVIKNLGGVELTKATIDYQIDGGPVVSRTYSVSAGNGLQPGKAMGLHGNASTVTPGTHTIRIWSALPNSVTDADAANDTLTSVFRVATPGQPLPFTEDFESVNPGAIPSDWTRYNRDAFGEWFVYGTATNKAAAFNNFAYTGAQNENDLLTMPIFDLTGSSTAWLTFDLCHAAKPNSTVYDSLEVLISTDCGLTFTPVWGSGGPGLSTVFDDANLFIPSGPQDYKNVQVDLSAYTMFNNAILRFVNWSNNGNSTLIDNVNLVTSVTGVQENNSPLSLHVYPNPATEFVQVSANVQTPGELKIQVLNAFGQTVEMVNYGLQQGNHFSRIDVKNYPAGIYNLIMTSGDVQMLSKKIVVLK